MTNLKSYLISGLNKIFLMLSKKRFLMPANNQYRSKHGTADLINDLIASIISKRDSDEPMQTNYLEIGIWQGYNLERIKASTKTGVDPKPKCLPTFQPNTKIFKGTSDVFFSHRDNTKHYSVIFIDGFHDAIQVYCDLSNALRVLTPDGLIVVDDVWPENYVASKRWVDLSQEEKLKVNKHALTWRGDIYKLILYLQNEPFLVSSISLDLIINNETRQAILKPKIDPTNLASFLDDARPLFLEYEKSVRNSQLWKNENHFD